MKKVVDRFGVEGGNGLRTRGILAETAGSHARLVGGSGWGGNIMGQIARGVVGGVERKQLREFSIDSRKVRRRH